MHGFKHVCRNEFRMTGVINDVTEILFLHSETLDSSLLRNVEITISKVLRNAEVCCNR